MTKRYFEDFPVGAVEEYGPRLVTREEIIAFAARFDPQPFHLDDEAGAASMLGGLSASGWHTSCLMMRMIADGLLANSSSMGAPGIEETRWLLPVRPGDSLTTRWTVKDKRISKSRPQMGFVTMLFEVLNQTGQRVLKMTAPMMFARRSPEPVDATSTRQDSRPAGA